MSKSSKCKFKVGDRVMTHGVVSDRNLDGLTAKVLCVFNSDGLSVALEFDTKLERTARASSGHSCAGKGKDGYCWWVNEENCTLIHKEELHITVDGTTTIGVYKNGNTTKKAVAKCSPDDTFDFKTGVRLVLERLGIVEKVEEAPHEYNPGDKVKIIANTCSHFGEIGEVVTLNDLLTTPDHKGRTRWHMYEQTGYIVEDDIEPYTESEKPKYYSGKIVCVKASTDHWTVGKVYEVKDGYVDCDKGLRHPRFGAPYADVDDVRHVGCDPFRDDRHNTRNEFIPLVED